MPVPTPVHASSLQLLKRVPVARELEQELPHKAAVPHGVLPILVQKLLEFRLVQHLRRSLPQAHGAFAVLRKRRWKMNAGRTFNYNCVIFIVCKRWAVNCRSWHHWAFATISSATHKLPPTPCCDGQPLHGHWVWGISHHIYEHALAWPNAYCTHSATHLEVN
jgi:hypothetical protein